MANSLPGPGFGCAQWRASWRQRRALQETPASPLPRTQQPCVVSGHFQRRAAEVRQEKVLVEGKPRNSQRNKGEKRCGTPPGHRRGILSQLAQPQSRGIRRVAPFRGFHSFPIKAVGARKLASDRNGPRRHNPVNMPKAAVRPRGRTYLENYLVPQGLIACFSWWYPSIKRGRLPA